jgi:beta-phosphoglucomutase
MTTPLQGLVFDFDGTLFDSEPVHFECYQILLSDHFKTSMDYNEYKNLYLGFEDRIFFKTFLSKKNIPFSPADIESLTQKKAKLFENLAHKVQPCPDSLDFVLSNKALFKMAICSGAYQSDILAVLNAGTNHKKVKDCMQVIVSSNDVSRPKPWPEGYLLACEKLGLHPNNCIAFEDSPTGLEAAQKAGLRAIALAHSHSVEKLKPLCPHVFESFKEVKLQNLSF